MRPCRFSTVTMWRPLPVSSNAIWGCDDAAGDRELLGGSRSEPLVHQGCGLRWQPWPCGLAQRSRQARTGAFDHWAETPEGALGLVILLDQVSRNIHRGTPLAFAADATGLALAKQSIARGFHQRMPAPKAMWFIMPFEHAENIDDQWRCVALFQTLGPERDGPLGQGASRHHCPVRPVSASQRGSGADIDAGGNCLPESWRFLRLVSDSALPRSFRLTPVEFRSLFCAQFQFPGFSRGFP